MNRGYFIAGTLAAAALALSLDPFLLAPACGQAASKWPAERTGGYDGPVRGPGYGQRVPPIIPPEQGTKVMPEVRVATNWVVPNARPVRYDQLELAIVSGSGTNLVATINNQSFKVGETFRVILGTNRVSVECLAIRPRSAWVKVQGEEAPRQLRLPPWR